MNKKKGLSVEPGPQQSHTYNAQEHIMKTNSNIATQVQWYQYI